MGLDVVVKRKKKIVCPHCGETVEYRDEAFGSSGGRVWYPFLESIGYYVPYDQRTEENDWYAKEMILTLAQTKELYQFLQKHDLLCVWEIKQLIATAICEGDTVAIYADW